MTDTGVHDVAISRLPAVMQAERARRIKRALDLSQKHVELPPAAYENPWREYKVVNEVFATTQMESDEKKQLADRWWMPYHIGREPWYAYDTKSAWFWKPEMKPRKGEMH